MILLNIRHQLSQLSKRWVIRGLVALMILSLLTPASYAAVTISPRDTPDLQRGTVTQPANNSTIISVQGFHFKGEGSAKKAARLVSVGPNGSAKWTYDGEQSQSRWFYDVDPLKNGNLLVVSTKPRGTLVYELNRTTKERLWVEQFSFDDTHDVDMLDDGRLVIAQMKNTVNGTSNDRVLIYNRSTDKVTWEWYFKNYYPNSTDGGMDADWTHLNDVDVLDDGRLLLSPRNFDQVIIINRSTKKIEMKLGADNRHKTLFEQHNPDLLRSENGTPTLLIADSENDRIVEYAKENGEWTKTWEVGTGQLNWPRDADRLPNGNTLITDTLNHRVIEVTPTGEIVWESYATWGPYEAERMGTGDGSSGPTIRDMNASGTYALHGSAGLVPGTGKRSSFVGTVERTFTGTPLNGAAEEFARLWSHVTPWIRPVWMTGGQFFGFALGVFLLAVWGLSEAVYQRHRIMSQTQQMIVRLRRT